MKISLTLFTIVGIVSSINISCNKNQDLQDENNTSNPNLLTLSSEVSQIEIGKTDGTLFFTDKQFLEAYNENITESNEQATHLHYLKSSNSIYKLGFMIHNNFVAYTYELTVDDNNIVSLGLAAPIETNTCAGDPCNSCDLVYSGGLWGTYSCNCRQKECSDCKCNHTVSQIHVGPTPSMEIVAYLSHL